MAQSGRLTTSDFMKMDKNDPRRQRWEETANKAHAQDMHELDKARYSSASRHKAVQDPDSLEARVRDNSSTYGKTAEGRSYLHNKDQQAKSQAGADARTAARDYASQRREDTKSAYLEGQAAGRVQGRTAQAAEGRGRGGYGGPPRGYGGRGGDPRQMRGGRGGFSSNPFRSGGMGRIGGRGRGGGRGISSGDRTINPVRSGGGSKGMVDQAAAGNAVAAAERYQNTGMKFNKEAQQWQHRDTGKAMSGKERADQVRHYGAYTEKGREGIGYSGKAPSNLEKGSDAYYGQEFSQSHARGSAWTEHQQKKDPTLDTKGLKSKWIEQRRAFDSYDPSSKEMADPALVNKVASHATEQINKQNQAKGGPTFKHETSGPVSKEQLDKFAAHMQVQMEKANKHARKNELSQKYDNEVFNREKGVVGQYFHDYAGTKPMKKGGDQAAYEKGMKDNWVERQMLGDKWDKEMMTWEGDKAQHPSGVKAQSTKGALHMLDYINTAGKKKEGQSNEDYYKGMKDAWIDKQQLGQKFDREVGTWQGDSDATWNQATKFRNDTEAGGYGNYVGDYAKANTDKKWDKAFFDSMKEDWISKQTGYAAGVKNKIAEVQGKGKGKDFLDSKIGKTPEKPKGIDVKDQIHVASGNLVSAVVKPNPISPPKAAPPKAAPPKGGMNTGATTDLKGKLSEKDLWDSINKDRVGGPNDQFIIGGGMNTMAMVPFYNKVTGEVFHGSHGGWRAKEGSDWVGGKKPDDWKAPSTQPPQAAPPKATKPPITPPSDPYIPPSPTPPSYQEPARDYIKYKNKKPGGVSSDAERYALLTGKPLTGGGTTTPRGGSSTPRGGSSTPDYSYDYGLGKGTSSDADRYALLTGNYSGKSYLDKYLNR